MKITVKRVFLEGLESLISAAKSDVAYAGKVTFGGLDDSRTSQVITIAVADETPSAAVEMAPGIGVTVTPE